MESDERKIREFNENYKDKIDKTTFIPFIIIVAIVTRKNKAFLVFLGNYYD